MRAAVIHDHGTTAGVEIADVAAPEVTAGSLRVELRAAALNHLDLFVIRGIPGLELPKPHVLGADGAGVVAEVGEGVDNLSVGDEVVLDLNDLVFEGGGSRPISFELRRGETL